MAIKLTTQYLSENEFLYDVAQSTGKFDVAMYEQQKKLGTSEQYAQLIAGTLTTEPKTTFDDVFYNKLSSEDKLAYITQKYYTDVGTDQYKANEEYFKQKEQEIKNKEIYEGLTGFEKAASTLAGWTGAALNSIVGIAEGLVDIVGVAAGAIAQASLIPLITGTSDDVSDAVKGFIASDTTGYTAIQKALANYNQAHTFIDKNGLAKGVNDLAANLGQYVTAFIPVVGPALYWASMFGNIAERNIHDNPDIDWATLMLSVAGEGGVEYLTEWAGGKVFPDDVLSSKLFGKNGVGAESSFWGKLASNFISEGLEEATAEMLGSIVHAALVTNDENDIASIKDILYAALIGGIMGAGMTTVTSLAQTKKYSVIDGELVETSTLTKEQRKQAKNLGLLGSHTLINKMQNMQEVFNEPSAVAELMTKYGTSLSDVKKNHLNEYQDAVEYDTNVDEIKANMALDLSNLLQTIGIDQFVKSAEILENNAAKTKEMVDNFLNHTDTLNKQASLLFTAANPGQTFTPEKITSQEQVVGEGLRKAFPQYRFAFGKYGSENGQPIRQINLDKNNKFIFIESGLVDKLGVEGTISRVIKQHIAQDVVTKMNSLPASKIDKLVGLITDKNLKYSDLTNKQKTTIAQMVCFDPIKNKKVFDQSKDVHKEIFNYITKQAGFVRDLGVKNKTNQIRYREHLKIRETFMDSIARTVYNKSDINAVKKAYSLSDEEMKTKIVFKTRPTLLNETTNITNLDFTEQGVAKRNALQLLIDSRADKTTSDFDWDNIYNPEYYDKSFVESLMQNEPDIKKFEPVLRDYINNQFNTTIDLNDKNALILYVNNNMTPQEIQKSAQIVLTKEFVDANKDSVLNSELGTMLYTLSGNENVVTEQDGVILTDSQIKGTGKFRFFKGEIDGRVYLSEERQRYLGESSDRELRWMEESATPTKYGDVTLTEISVLPEFYANKKDEYQRKYNIRVGFYIGDVTYHSNIDGDITLDNATGYTDQNKVLLKIDNVTEQELDITMFHEHLHNLISKHKNLLLPFAEKIKKQIGADEWNRLLTDLKEDDMYGQIVTDEVVLIEELVVKMATHYLVVVKEDVPYTKLFKEFYDELSKKGKVVIDLVSGKNTPRDSTGRLLSKDQQEYFKNSVVRDKNGNLLVMYHGTSYYGFNIFNIYGGDYGLFGTGGYFTENRSVGESYQEKGRGKSKGVYVVYLNITHPIDMDAVGNRAEWIKSFPEAEEYFPETGTNEQFYRAVEQYIEDENLTRDEASDYAMSGLMDMGYDGITHIGGGRLTDNSVRHRVYIAFYPEQIKKIDNKFPTESGDIRFSLSKQNKQETSIQQKINKAESPKQIADVITAIIEAAPLEVSETKGYGDEGTRLYKKTSDEMRRKYASLWTKITQENYDKVRNELVKSDYEYADEALLIFDRFTRAYAGNSTKFDEATKKKIMDVGSRKQTIAAISQGLQSAELANEHSFGETAAAFEKDGYKVTVSNDTVKEYVPEMANKKEFIKELDKEISNLEEQIKIAETDIDAAELNNQLDKAVEKRIVMSEGTNEEIMDWVIKNEDIVTKASKLQKEIFEQMVEKGELAQKEGKKAVTILVDEKTGLPKPFPKTTQFIEKNVKRLKSFRMWSMLTSPVSWVRNWVGNAGMTALDGMTNSLEKFITSKQKVMSQQELAKLEKQHQELSRKAKPTDAEKSKLAQLSNQIARNYDFKFVETKASKDLRKQIADDYKDVIQQILNGEDVKYESSAEKAAAITRAERKITRASQNANLGQKLWAACQSMTDWGLNTGWFGDNAVVVNSLVKNFANMVESNKTYLIKSLTTEYGKDGRGMSAERKALVEKALKTKDSMDIVNAMSKYDVTLFMDSCKQRTFEQYFKNSNWLSQWASNLSKKHPIAASLTSLVLPFPKVAANILSMAYKYSPLGFLSAARQWSVVKQMDAAGYEGVRDAFARAKAGRTTSQATVGSFMMLAGLILASLGFIDIDDDDYLGPSLKVGDWKVSLSNLAPSMTTFSVGSAMMWAWKNDQSATLKALDVLYDNTLLGNIENVFRYGDPSKYIENLSINYFSQYVPAMLKLFTKFTTNQEMIDKSGSYFAKLGKTFASGIPFIANTLPKKINPYTGETLTGTGTSNIFFNFIEALSPLDMRFDVKSATQKEAERLATESTGLSGTFKVNDKEYVVDKVTYSKYRANYIQDNFDKILSGKVKVTVEDENGKRITTTYNKLTDKQKKNVINRLYTEATSMTKIKWWTDQGNKYVVTNRDLYNEYRKMFKNIIYKKNWSKSKFVES